MFHIRLAVLCLAIFSIDQAEFQKTQVQELQEYAPFFYKKIHKKDSKIKAQEAYPLLIACCQKYKNDAMTLAELYERIGLDAREVQVAFDRLKQLMNIPDEVVLLVSGADPDQSAEYHPLTRAVMVHHGFFARCKSIQLFMLIHELTHCQQHMRDGLLKHLQKSSYESEHEADTQAAIAIQCPDCLWFIQRDYKRTSKQRRQGYLGESDFDTYRKKKLHNDICDGCKANSFDLGLYVSNVDFKECKLKR